MTDDLFGGETSHQPEDFEPDEWREFGEDIEQRNRAIQMTDRWNEVSSGS